MSRLRPLFSATTAMLAVFLLSVGVAPARNFPEAGGPGTEPAPPEAGLSPAFQGMPPPAAQVSVKLRDGTAARDLDGLFGTSFLRENVLTRVATLRLPTADRIDEVVTALQRHPLVEWAEPVQWRRLTGLPLAPLEPDDSNYQDFQRWYYELIGAPGGWGIETGRPAVTIAILDSGVLCAHPDLVDNIWKNPREIPGNGIDDDGNGYIDDVNGWDLVAGETGEVWPTGDDSAGDMPADPDPCVRRDDPSIGNARDDDGDGVADSGVVHGTATAGVAAARGDNGRGVAGMCWFCSIISVRVANPEGWVRSSDVADGITYAARVGARVINLSLGGTRLSEAERRAVDFAVGQGAVIVAAAGNENRSPISFPAQLSSVIAVGASDKDNPKGRARFSNWGAGGLDDRQVDVVAPGVRIATTGVNSLADQAIGMGTAGTPRYTQASGTSFSAPLVSGLVGLMLSRNPTLSPADIKARLKAGAVPLADDPTDSPNAGPGWAGAGMVNAQATLERIAAPAGATPTPTRTPRPTFTPLPTTTPSATATATPLTGTGTRPQPLAPGRGASLTSLGTTLTWTNPPGATQFQIHVVPARNDGPAINLIRNIDTSYTVEAPVFGAGPYVMLPDLTYTWRVRTTTATTGIDENSTQWGAWSESFTFRTRTSLSTGITALQPPGQATGVGLTPALQWNNTDANVFYYEVQLSKDPTFDVNPATATAMVYWNLVHGAVSSPLNSYTVPASFPLEARMRYFWRVRPRVQGDGVPVPWSGSFSFMTR